jgi:periplasmic protein TonB
MRALMALTLAVGTLLFGSGYAGAQTSQAALADYPPSVRAHLAHHQRPSVGQGRSLVAFAVDGRGRLTRVSVVRGSGSAMLDREATSMVRRASPFPAPPDGTPKTFTVLIRFWHD